MWSEATFIHYKGRPNSALPKNITDEQASIPSVNSRIAEDNAVVNSHGGVVGPFKTPVTNFNGDEGDETPQQRKKKEENKQVDRLKITHEDALKLIQTSKRPRHSRPSYAIGPVVKNEKRSNLEKDTVVQLTTYYNNKINQLTTERTSLQTENSSLETNLKNLQTEYSATLTLNKAYKQNVDDMRGERDLAEKRCEEETKKRKLVEEELEGLKAKIRRLV